jgi:hypothetical protein
MQIGKQQIIDMLEDRGGHDKATQAQADLPDQIDTGQHAGMLSNSASTRRTCSASSADRQGTPRGRPSLRA